MDKCQVLNFFVQSAEQSSTYLLSRIYAFLMAVPAQLGDAKFTDEKLKKIIEAQIAARENPPESVAAEANNLWARKDHPFGFGARAAEIALLKEGVTIEDLRQFAADHLD